MNILNPKNLGHGHYVYRRYVTRNGKRVYPTKARVLRFWVSDDK